MEVRVRFNNLTPHDVKIVVGETVTVIPPSGVEARVSATDRLEQVVDGIPLFETFFGEVTGLPDAEENITLIVSAMVVSASPGRTDLRSPAKLIRDSSGAVIGCAGLTRPARA
jgi:hypothetical protein